jgi:cytochrome b561
MGLANSPVEWGAVSQALHWTIALIFAAQFVTGFLRHWKLISNDTWTLLFTWAHLPLGFLVLVLFPVRFLWRAAQHHPPLPERMTWPERLGANVAHAYLYAAMVAMPLTGLIGFNALNIDLSPFGVKLPRLISDARPLSFLAADVHLWIAYGIAAVVALHVAGAVKHHWLDKDDVLAKMMPFGWLKR